VKNFIYLAAFVLISLTLLNCGGNKELSQTKEGDIPEWYLTPPSDPNYIFVPRTATSKDMQLAIDKAVTDARAEVGRVVETKIEGLQKKFDEEVGVAENSTLLQQFTSAQKTVVSTSLSGSQVKKQEVLKDGETWRAYVLVEYPIGAANTAFVEQMKKQEELYTRYRSSETFKDLENEVKKYEEWKEKQK
jgi:hypothetical protein